jgi:arginyl-tRNA--protein-N-Asp/Glu arginylyltransferase
MLTSTIPLFLTQEHPCGYLENRQARSLFVNPSYEMTPTIYYHLLQRGFRRSGNEVYMPCCETCSACIPARLPVGLFQPDRRQRRCLSRNRATQAVIKPAEFDAKHYALYLRYQSTRHGGGTMERFTPEDYTHFLTSCWCDTQLIEFSIDKRLSAVAIIDCFDNAWSAMYTFFEPDFSTYSPGMYSVLWQIEQLKREHKQYLYLGFWIKNCQKMAYKTDYGPLELFLDKQWMQVDDPDSLNAAK